MTPAEEQALRRRVSELVIERDDLRKALGFYAMRGTWDESSESRVICTAEGVRCTTASLADLDRGKRARKALGMST